MNKKHIFTAIGIFVLTSIYVGICNFILQGEEASIDWAIFYANCVSLLTVITYILLLVALGFGYEKKYQDKVQKFLIIFQNIIDTCLLWAAIIIFIASNNTVVIPQSYAWIHFVSLLFAIAIVFKANYDAKGIRENKNMHKENAKYL